MPSGMTSTGGVLRLAGKKELDAATERALVEGCRRQDFEAFGKIVDAYQARLVGFVRRMTPNNEDAQDIAQETFVRAFQSFARFDGRSSVRTWLFRIAHNLCIDRARQSRTSVAETPIDFELEDSSPREFADLRWDPEQIVLDDELAAVLERAIGRMSEKLRAVLLLHDREELSYEEISEAVGIPIGTVKSRLFLARAHIQREVESYWKEGQTS